MDNPAMTYAQALKFFGTQAKLGAALGIGQSAVSLWGKEIPSRYQYQLEIISGGRLKVDAQLRLPMSPRQPVSA